LSRGDTGGEVPPSTEWRALRTVYRFCKWNASPTGRVLARDVVKPGRQPPPLQTLCRQHLTDFASIKWYRSFARKRIGETRHFLKRIERYCPRAGQICCFCYGWGDFLRTLKVSGGWGQSALITQNRRRVHRPATLTVSSARTLRRSAA